MIPTDLLNHLYHGPIEEVLKRLPDESVDTIFADPDYNVGIIYEGKKYTTKFNDYIESTVAWAKECHRVLKPTGNFFIINYPRNNAYLRVRYLDEAFYDIHDYAWVYKTNIGQGPRHFTTAHRSILHCVKSPDNHFFKEAVAVPYQNPADKRIRKLIEEGSPGRMPYSWIEAEPTPPSDTDRSWFEFNLVKNVGRSKSFHSCQIPEALSELLFKATCKKGDTVLVLFGGAGSELVVCQRLKLNWVSAELVPQYQQLIAERLKHGGDVPTESRMLTAIKARQSNLRGQTKLLGDHQHEQLASP
ncbi:MAG: site-specific DNA-methyltransferase [Nitrososphaerota archaeon]|jgi:DNA modification methylase|nr:site-specific DNA-methyltransferase [Nitrososphaerota archaeon]